MTKELIIKYGNEVTSSPVFQGLIALIALDILTGVAKAIKNKKINSTIGINGLIKHTVVMLLQGLIAIYVRAVGGANLTFISKSIGIFYIAQYGFSLIENLNELNVPLPLWVSKFFSQLREQNIEIPNVDVMITTHNQKKNKEVFNKINNNKELDVNIK
ncbi:phage holin family protein [Helcococcus bovis]|uniref:phage holin family protein n=1 Tax=Helcococcus bovis TaxID=3153252 RepID=UPI0038B90DDB